jgi:hypothetical protein
MKQVLRIVYILILFAVAANLCAQSYYARKNIGVGVSTGCLLFRDKAHNMNAAGLSLMKQIDIVIGGSQIFDHSINVYSLSYALNGGNNKRLIFPSMNFGFTHIRINDSEYTERNDHGNLGLGVIINPFYKETNNKDLYIIPSFSFSDKEDNSFNGTFAINLAYGHHINEHIVLSFEPGITFSDDPTISASVGVYLE